MRCGTVGHCARFFPATESSRPLLASGLANTGKVFYVYFDYEEGFVVASIVCFGENKGGAGAGGLSVCVSHHRPFITTYPAASYLLFLCRDIL